MRKTVTLKWDKVYSPLEEGGLGIRRLDIINKALLMKLVWKVQQGEEVWALFFQSKFKKKNREWITYYRESSIWTGLRSVMNDVEENSRWLVGDGKNIDVWEDAWIKDKP